ncbi:MAG: DMT family transporter [Pseudonocardiaceae bacterium]
MWPATRGPALIVALALLWGSNFAWIKISLDSFSPIQVTFGRMLLGALILLGVVAITHDQLPHGRSIWAHLTVAALVANAAPYLLFALGETRVDSSIAGVMNATTPLWTLALVAAARTTEPIRPTQVAGFVLGLTGCIVIFAPGNSGTLDPLGTLYCLLAAVSYAISYVYMARYLAPKPITPTALAAAQLIAATGWTLPALAAHPEPVPAYAPGPWAALAILGILGTGLAYIINYALIRNEGPTHASAVTYLVPIVSVTIGAAALSEPLTPSLLTGSTLVLIGIALSHRTPPIHNARQASHSRQP